MPVIQFYETVPAADGSSVPAVGRFQFTPSGSVINGTQEVLAKPFTAALDGTGRMSVNLAATTSNWAWRVDMDIRGVPPQTVYVSVLSSDTQWANLTRVDPHSLTAIPAFLPPPWVANINIDGGTASG
ncbi:MULTISPECIES: hypothetical protein [Arthrobacter]|uniref:Uncharacterized protein n=1 Tax=Arthrobacter terricola TaxID=2547396 RepID=A0A4R5KQ38_9MICC|nr:MULTISPECIES: hypothetical protein [Arthrobacter]MBT8160984.1 hypothetical protein [Arthrobacter sp. GN70]TDF96847.1 hypothetical protein E1809_08985 [Arthrobacter terricola]